MSSKWVLDTTKARDAGAPIPIGGVMRGEQVNILARHDDDTSDVQFAGEWTREKYAELVFRVSNDCLIEVDIAESKEPAGPAVFVPIDDEEPELAEPNHSLIAALAEGPDSQIDAQVAKILKTLKDKTRDEVKDGLHKALDYGARYGMASSMVMTVLDGEWKRLGGKPTDPAPWQDEMKGS